MATDPALPVDPALPTPPRKKPNNVDWRHFKANKLKSILKADPNAANVPDLKQRLAVVQNRTAGIGKDGLSQLRDAYKSGDMATFQKLRQKRAAAIGGATGQPTQPGTPPPTSGVPPRPNQRPQGMPGPGSASSGSFGASGGLDAAKRRLANMKFRRHNGNLPKGGPPLGPKSPWK